PVRPIPRPGTVPDHTRERVAGSPLLQRPGPMRRGRGPLAHAGLLVATSASATTGGHSSTVRSAHQPWPTVSLPPTRRYPGSPSTSSRRRARTAALSARGPLGTRGRSAWTTVYSKQSVGRVSSYQRLPSRVVLLASSWIRALTWVACRTQ